MDKDLKPELPLPPWLVIPAESLIRRVGTFALFLFFIYIVMSVPSVILVRFGNAQYSAGNNSLGTASYKLALELNSSLKKAANQCYDDIDRQQYQLAIKHCSSVINIDGQFAAAYSQRGLAYLKLKQYDQAIADFDKDLELIPVATRSYINRAGVYMQLNKYDLAIQDLTKSIEINPNEEQAWLNRGLSYVYQRKTDLAISDCNKAIEIEKYWNAYSCLAIAYSLQGKYDLATKNFAKAIDLAPKMPMLYFTRGAMFEKQGKKDLALADYSTAIEIDPAYHSAYASRGVLYTAQGNYDLALLDFNKALEIDPNSADVYVLRGNALADTKQFPKAIADYQKAIATTNNARIISYASCVQGVTYTKMGDFESAIPSLEQGVKMDTANENGWCKTALENARQGIPTP
jgi:tetratricopeptide (TPR) repeat protein